MKISKTISASIIISFFSINGFAQNVGIGVVTPLQKLHVGGNVRIDGMASPGTGIITTNASGDLLRTNFSGNANDVLKGNGTFGTLPSGLPSGAIVASASPNDANLLAAGYSFFGELSNPTSIYTTFPATVSTSFAQAPTYENGNSAKTPPPTGRAGAFGLWTGTEALIWGGFTESGTIFNFYNDGSRYNPSTDSWTPISTVGAPSSRTYSASVWTGTEMLIWAGLDSAYNDFNGNQTAVYAIDGGRYDPSTNTWTTMSTTGAPAPRYRIPAVWTGTYMVVWGGQDFNLGPIPNGGRYNATANSWSAVPTLNAPGADYGTRLFWTGTYVLALGNLDSIGRYNPSSNTWAAITKFPGGPNYDKNAAIWTGTELWIYIQSTQNLYKYNPTTNIWTAPIVIGGTIFPDSKFALQAALWSDAEMILYGNVGDANFKTTGNRYYRYNPGSNDFNTDNNEFIKYNRLVNTEVLFFKAGSLILKWGGYISVSDETTGSSIRFSKQGTRIYLSSGISIPTIYVSGSANNSLYLYQKN